MRVRQTLWTAILLLISTSMGCAKRDSHTDNEPLPEFSDPRSTYRTYIEAIRRNDAEVAKKCWTIDDNNESGALDVIVGLWISSRKLNDLAAKKFDDSEKILKGWHRTDLTNQALDLTKRRVDDAEMKIHGDVAELTIKWDEYEEAFEFGRDPIPFRRVGRHWKIDANGKTGLKHGADFFEPGTWGPMFRDQIEVMNRTIAALEQGELKTSEQTASFIEAKMAVLRKKYEDERERVNDKRR